MWCDCSFLSVLMVSAWVYYNLILGVEIEEYGGHGMVLQQGFMPAFGLFLVSGATHRAPSFLYVPLLMCCCAVA